MLKGIDPLLPPDLLGLIAGAGHAEVIAVVDRNFPARSVGAPVVELPAVTVPEALAAICSLLPVDRAQPSPVKHMTRRGGVDGPAVPEVRAVLELAEGAAVGMEGLERLAFVAAAKQAYAVVRTGDDRPVACYLVAKGVV